MPILSSKLHYLNRKLQEISVEVCTARLWPTHKKNNEVILSIVERSKLFELETICRELREACKEDAGL